MLIIKGDRVKFRTEDDKIISLPARYGIIHDPEGRQRPRCDVYFGPFRLTPKAVEMTSSAKRYLGSNYTAKAALVNLPRGPWNPVAKITMIYYRRGVRKGAAYAGMYHHPFKQGVKLERSGRFYRLDLPNGCIVDDRGFVFP